jgi:hypothetical protein
MGTVNVSIKTNIKLDIVYAGRNSLHHRCYPKSRLAPFIRREYDVEGGHKSSHSAFVSHLKKYFLLPPTFREAHIRRPWFFSIPLRSQIVLIAIYLILNVVFLSIHYHLFLENL